MEKIFLEPAVLKKWAGINALYSYLLKAMNEN